MTTLGSTLTSEQQSGIFYDMPASEYFSSKALGSTSIKTLGDPELSLADVWHEMHTDEHKPEYDMGTLGHALILEGSLDHLVERIDADNYRTKAAREARAAAYSAGKIPINDSEAETMLAPLDAIRDSVMNHPIAGELLTGHQPEVSVFWDQDRMPAKGRLDAYHPDKGLVVDLKLLRSARPNDVRKQISDLGYYIQARHYLNGMKAITGFEPDWLFVVVGKTEPYTVSVHRLHPDALLQAQSRINYGIARYKQATDTGEWPGYESIYEQSLTPWESIKNEEMEMI